MDPYNITEESFKVLALTADATKVIRLYAATHRDTRTSLAALGREVGELEMMIEIIKQDKDILSGRSSGPPNIAERIAQIIQGSEPALQDIQKLLTTRRNKDVAQAAWWMVSGKEQVLSLETRISASRIALSLALDVAHQEASAQIPRTLEELESILAKMTSQEMPAGTTVDSFLQNWWEEMSVYSGSLYSGSILSSLTTADNGESKSFPPAMGKNIMKSISARDKELQGLAGVHIRGLHVKNNYHGESSGTQSNNSAAFSQKPESQEEHIETREESQSSSSTTESTLSLPPPPFSPEVVQSSQVKAKDLITGGLLKLTTLGLRPIDIPSSDATRVRVSRNQVTYRFPAVQDFSNEFLPPSARLKKVVWQMERDFLFLYHPHWTTNLLFMLPLPTIAGFKVGGVDEKTGERQLVPISSARTPKPSLGWSVGSPQLIYSHKPHQRLIVNTIIENTNGVPGLRYHLRIIDHEGSEVFDLDKVLSPSVRGGELKVVNSWLSPDQQILVHNSAHIRHSENRWRMLCFDITSGAMMLNTCAATLSQFFHPTLPILFWQVWCTKSGEELKMDDSGQHHAIAMWHRSGYIISYIPTSLMGASHSTNYDDLGFIPGGSMGRVAAVIHRASRMTTANGRKSNHKIHIIDIAEKFVFTPPQLSKFGQKAEESLRIAGAHSKDIWAILTYTYGPYDRGEAPLKSMIHILSTEFEIICQIDNVLEGMDHVAYTIPGFLFSHDDSTIIVVYRDKIRQWTLDYDTVGT